MHQNSELFLQKYTFVAPYRQKFSLPFDSIYYMIKNVSKAAVYLKLLKTCKYFYIKNRKFVDEALNLWNGELYEFYKYFLQRISRVPHCLFFKENYVLPKLLEYICFYKYSRLHIYDVNLTLNEYDCLIQNQKINYVWMQKTIILDEDGNKVSMDVILQKTPHLTYFYYDHNVKGVTEKIFQNMNSAAFKLHKLKTCHINFVDLMEEIDVELLIDFVKNHASDDSYFNFRFRYPILHTYYEKIYAKLETLKEGCFGMTLQIWLGRVNSFSKVV